MEPLKFRSKTGPEAIIQRNFIDYLKDRNWGVERMIGNALQMGIPDIYIMHPEHKTRWVDLKNPLDYEFTAAQRYKWPRWEQKGTGIWIITGWSDADYDVLFGPPNWRQYWKPKYDEQAEELEMTMQELFAERELEL
jgi:hypothetical protein